ncbi:FTR1 family protein [Asticcacaulis sp. EMRT-3]|uniref:FTR1 family iron permease n=1 Tax=Asticcacaulis sp. EMRT-3 TaxID=3040349 RepID=UPI0024AF6700|nr:FTR1 family protein [Asticcacaulis sp. EMRT-3]MDI7776534.1 FTR1 family protein [Asticcacaulis sp. EMRT-3]
MLATLIIVLRELIEAGLIVGIVLAATRGVPTRGLWIGGGIVGGIIGACLIALFTGAISQAFQGVGQELFDVCVLLIAVAMLTWHNVWMASHGREIAAEMQAAGSAVVSGQKTLTALAVVVGIAVLREGSEIVLFLYGIAISGQEKPVNMVLGGGFGLVLGVGLSALMYLGLLRIPMRHFFKVTGIMIALLSAGLLAQAASFLEQAGILNIFASPLWDSSWLLAQDSLFGKIMHTLIGYMDHPTGAELLAYGMSLVVTFGLMRLVAYRSTQ